MLPLEAARSGRRVLVTCNNPILQFVLKVLARAPREEDFTVALAEWVTTRRGNERLENVLSSMYLTRCPSCGRSIQAEAFIWPRDFSAPQQRIFRCPHCGESGERPAGETDLALLKQIGNAALHKARALQRISRGDGTLPEGAAEALDAYLPRSLDFIFILLNKLDSLPISPEKRELLQALLLSVCDEGSALWSWPGTRSRPKTLTIAPQFRENNLWAMLENAASAWVGQPNPVPLVFWPELPPLEGGICIFPGRLKTLLSQPSQIPFHAAAAVIPRPNQAFWTLSAVWSGWLWGREATQPLHAALERRRYDWQWHAHALHSTLSILHHQFPDDFSLLTIVPELAPGFASAWFTSAVAAGFQLEGLAYSTEHETAQATWSTVGLRSDDLPANLPAYFRQEIHRQLTAINQPSDFLSLQIGCLASMASAGLLPTNQNETRTTLIGSFQSDLETTFSDRSFLVRFHSTAQTSERGLWWLASTPSTQELSLADRVEHEVIRFLQAHTDCTTAQLVSAVNALFTGVHSPPSDLLLACASSYAELVSVPPDTWRVRESELPSARQKDLVEMHRLLITLAKRLGFTPQGDLPILWVDSSGAERYRFYPAASGVVSPFVLGQSATPGVKNILLLPGSRLDLLALKLRLDPRLEQILKDWRILKFRHLRWIAQVADLHVDLWENLLVQDPATLEAPVQMALW